MLPGKCPPTSRSSQSSHSESIVVTGTISQPSFRPSSQSEAFTVLGLINVILRRRDPIVAVAVLAVAFVAILSLTRPRTFTSVASFAPQAQRLPSNMSGLAAQLGIAIPGGEISQSPQFYEDLLSSREILGRLVDTTFQIPTVGGERATTLADFFRIGIADSARRREETMQRLRNVITTSLSAKTGVVGVSVSTQSAVLSRALVQRLLEEVNRFNLVNRQSQAAAERQFTEHRLEEVKNELRVAENSLQAFLTDNRAYQNSPQLRFEQDRLAREVSLRQSLYTSMAQAYEQARIEEVRDTPVITIVEHPDLPARPDARGTVKKSVLALLAGAFLGLVLTIVVEIFDAGRLRDDDYEAFLRLRYDAVADLKKPWRPAVRIARRMAARSTKTAETASPSGGSSNGR